VTVLRWANRASGYHYLVIHE